MEKEIHQIHDKFFKLSLQDLRVAKDFFIAYLPKVILDQVNLATLKLQKESFIDPNYQAFEADVIYQIEIAGNQGVLYTLCEHQSIPDKMLPLRIAHYIILLLKNFNHQYPDQPLPVVYPIIVYIGEKAYNFSTNFFDLFGTQGTVFKEILVNPIHLIDVCRLEDEDIHKRTWFGLVEFAFKNKKIRDFENLLDQLLPWLDKIHRQNGSELAMIMLEYILRSYPQGDLNIFNRKISVYLPEKLKGDAMTIAEQLRKQGRDEGLKQGVKQGVRRGVKQGMKQEKLSLASKLIIKGLRLSEILELTGLTAEELRQLQEQVDVH